GSLQAGVYPVKWADPSVQTLFPHLSMHRQVIKLIVLRSLVAASEGRTEDAIDSLDTAMNTDRCLVYEPSVVGGLVRIACQSMCAQLIGEMLCLTPLTDAQLSALQMRILEMENSKPLVFPLIGERATLSQSIAWSYAHARILDRPLSMSRWAPAFAQLEQ